jgi:DNA invertase Pin-like site-specific DNA recombinase
MVKSPTKSLVAYYRVSTARQGRSGLGLEAQKQAVEEYARAGGLKIVAEYTEVESGRNNDRQELRKAIARTRACRGRLLIARLCRLARNVHFVSGLMESGVEFSACDMPDANRLTVHVMAAMAEHEARCISERTTVALQAAKRRGTLLGTHNPSNTINWRKGQRNGLHKAQDAAAESAAKLRSDCYSHIFEDMNAWRTAGESYRAIADRLNAAGEVTTGGKAFAAMTVQRLLG